MGRDLVRQVVDDEAGGAPPRRVLDEGVAVQVMPADGEKGLPHPEAPAVNADPDHGDPEITPDQGPVDGSNHFLHRERRHMSPYGERSERI